MDTQDLNDDLKQLAPTLASVPKADPFVTPEPFFEGFPHQVQAAIAAGQRTARPHWYRRWALALPAAALVGLGAWWALSGTRTEEHPTVLIAQVTPLAADELDYFDGADVDELAAETLPAEDLGAVHLDLKDEELLAYLDHEQADLTELITEE